MIIKSQNKVLKTILFLSLLGIVLSAYLTYIHYSQSSSPCDFSKTISCSFINRSKYAEIGGVSVSLIGLLGYSLLGLISFSLLKKGPLPGLFTKKISSKHLIFLSLIAVVFTFYLTYTEFFLVKAVCVLCLISQVSILAITLLSYNLFKLEKEVG